MRDVIRQCGAAAPTQDWVTFLRQANALTVKGAARVSGGCCRERLDGKLMAALAPLYFRIISRRSLWLTGGDDAAALQLHTAWRYSARGAVFSAPAVVPGSGAVVLADVEGVLHALSVDGAGLSFALPCIW